MDLLTKYPHALEQLAILKKDYLGVDTATELSYSIEVGQHNEGKMESKPFYTKYDFVKLMRQKRGTEYTFGWLAMAYSMPPTTEAQELEVIQKEVPVLEALPDYDGI